MDEISADRTRKFGASTDAFPGREKGDETEHRCGKGNPARAEHSPRPAGACAGAVGQTVMCIRDRPLTWKQRIGRGCQLRMAAGLAERPKPGEERALDPNGGPTRKAGCPHRINGIGKMEMRELRAFRLPARHRLPSTCRLNDCLPSCLLDRLGRPRRLARGPPTASAGPRSSLSCFEFWFGKHRGNAPPPRPLNQLLVPRTLWCIHAEQCERCHSIILGGVRIDRWLLFCP